MQNQGFPARGPRTPRGHRKQSRFTLSLPLNHLRKRVVKTSGPTIGGSSLSRRATMRAKPRSSIRWRVATAVVALALCTLPRAAFPDGGGNGRLIAVRLPEPAAAMTGQQDEQPIEDLVDTAGPTPKIR